MLRRILPAGLSLAIGKAFCRTCTQFRIPFARRWQVYGKLTSLPYTCHILARYLPNACERLAISDARVWLSSNALACSSPHYPRHSRTLSDGLCQHIKYYPMSRASVALTNQNTFLLHGCDVTLYSPLNYRQNYRHLLCRNKGTLQY